MLVRKVAINEEQVRAYLESVFEEDLHAKRVLSLAHATLAYVMAEREEAWVALDWTDFEAGDHTTLVASLVTSHGRATPLLWMTLQKSALAGNRAQAEDELLLRLKECVPEGVKGRGQRAPGGGPLLPALLVRGNVQGRQGLEIRDGAVHGACEESRAAR